jgi:hypothetical protein
MFRNDCVLWEILVILGCLRKVVDRWKILDEFVRIDERTSKVSAGNL